MKYISYTLENIHIALTLVDYWSIRKTKKKTIMEQRNCKKKHWIDDPGAWEKWKKEQGARKNEKGAKKKEKGARG